MVTARDALALRLAYDFRFLSIGQASACVYDNHNVAQRRLSALAQKERLLHPMAVCRGTRGHPLRVYYLEPRSKRRIAELIEVDALDPNNLVRTVPDGRIGISHLIELNDVLAALVVSCRAGGYSFEFIPEHWTPPPGTPCLTESVQDPMTPGRTAKYRRDAVCCVGGERGKALFELEYDRGRENLTASRYRKVTIARKIAIFMASLREKRFERYANPLLFGYAFKTSRLLIVTSSEKRACHIAELCQALETHGLVYVTSRDRVQAAVEGVLGPIWFVADGDLVHTRALVGGA